MKILYVYDLDATCMDASFRHTVAGPEPERSNRKKYIQWLSKVQNKKSLLKDKPVIGMKELCNLTKKNAIYLTSRQESYREVTKKWLKKHKFPNLPLYMRKRGDWESSGKFKESVLLGLIKKNTKLIIFDDDQKGCLLDVCKRRKWTLLKAMSGS